MIYFFLNIDVTEKSQGLSHDAIKLLLKQCFDSSIWSNINQFQTSRLRTIGTETLHEWLYEIVPTGASSTYSYILGGNQITNSFIVDNPSNLPTWQRLVLMNPQEAVKEIIRMLVFAQSDAGFQNLVDVFFKIRGNINANPTLLSLQARMEIIRMISGFGDPVIQPQNQIIIRNVIHFPHNSMLTFYQNIARISGITLPSILSASRLSGLCQNPNSLSADELRFLIEVDTWLHNVCFSSSISVETIIRNTFSQFSSDVITPMAAEFRAALRQHVLTSASEEERKWEFIFNPYNEILGKRINPFDWRSILEQAQLLPPRVSRPSFTFQRFSDPTPLSIGFDTIPEGMTFWSPLILLQRVLVNGAGHDVIGPGSRTNKYIQFLNRDVKGNVFKAFADLILSFPGMDIIFEKDDKGHEENGVRVDCNGNKITVYYSDMKIRAALVSLFLMLYPTMMTCSRALYNSYYRSNRMQQLFLPITDNTLLALQCLPIFPTDALNAFSCLLLYYYLEYVPAHPQSNLLEFMGKIGKDGTRYTIISYTTIRAWLRTNLPTLRAGETNPRYFATYDDLIEELNNPDLDQNIPLYEDLSYDLSNGRFDDVKYEFGFGVGILLGNGEVRKPFVLHTQVEFASGTVHPPFIPGQPASLDNLYNDYWGAYQTGQVTWSDVFMQRYQRPMVTTVTDASGHTVLVVHLIYKDGSGKLTPITINIHVGFFGG